MTLGPHKLAVRARGPVGALLLAAALAFVPSTSSSGGQDSGGQVEAGPAGFEAEAKQFFGTYCIKCHGERRPKGGVRLDTISFDLSQPETLATWDRVFSQVLFREMPPPKQKRQPDIAQRAAFVDLVKAELGRHGAAATWDEKLRLPQYGNLVPHEKLFDGSVTELPATPARLWRQRPSIYDGIWQNAYGRAPWYSVKIGGTGVHRIERGPHKGKMLAHRYFSDAKYANPFFEFVHHASGFTDYASILADQSSLEALLVNAETMAEILTLGQKVRVVTQVKNKGSRTGNNEAMFVGGVTTTATEYRGRVPKVFREIMEAEGAVPRKVFDEALDVAFALFLRRAPREQEYQHYWDKVFQKNLPLGNTMALQSVLIYITLAPEFVYRMELGMGERDDHGRRFLSPQELVYALQYALFNKPAFGVADFETVDVYTKKSEPPIRQKMTTPRPVWAAHNSLIADEMEAGRLKTRADVERIVRRALRVEDKNWLTNHNRTHLQSPHPRVVQFFREFFGYYKAPEVFKDTDKFKQRDGFRQFGNGTANKLVYDTDSLVRYILSKDRQVLRELLTTDKVVISYLDGGNQARRIKRAGGREKYRRAQHTQNYNLDPFELADARLEVGRPKQSRRRAQGKDRLFRAPAGQRCGILTQPSWLVAHSGNFDNDPVRRGKWIREKLLAGQVLDLPITVDAQIPDDEHRTLRDRFSVVEAAECWRCHRSMNPLGMPFEAYNHVGRWRAEELGKPVDTSGAISRSADPSIHGEVKDVHELMERLAGSALVRQSFIRHVFRFWMGRNEQLSDSKTLIAMDNAYVESDGSFKELLVSLLTSDSFLYRR